MPEVNSEYKSMNIILRYIMLLLTTFLYVKTALSQNSKIIEWTFTKALFRVLISKYGKKLGLSNEISALWKTVKKGKNLIYQPSFENICYRFSLILKLYC